MENTAKTLKLGIVGCGSVTETFHIPSLRSLHNVEVIALSDIDKNRLRQLGDRFKIRYTYEDSNELINHPDVEAVAVCAPSQYHFSLGMTTLDAGKHLFLEKPIALSLVESDKLIKKVANCSARIVVGLNLRWHDNVRRAKVYIREGKLGSIKLIRSVITTNRSILTEWRKNRGLGGGAILDLAIHHFDLLRYLLDTEVEEVYAKSISSDTQDEVATVMLKMSNGIISSSIFSFTSSINNEIEIYGDSGSLKLSIYDTDGLEFSSSTSAPSKFDSTFKFPFQKLINIVKNAKTVINGGIFKQSYKNEWQGFVDSVMHNKDTECNLEDGRRALEISLLAVESALTGKPIKLI